MKRNFVLIVGILISFITRAPGAEEVKITTTINSAIVTQTQISEALFPPKIAAMKEECAQMEKIGIRCQSVIPKSSMDTALVTFDRGSSQLTPAAKEMLGQIGSVLQAKSKTWQALSIEGHTDITGTIKMNQKLSKERAETVKEFLTKEYGLQNITTIGRASDKLYDVANKESGTNRRIEFVPAW
jgi:outer membrane protein OmpA-like peptidoglycan-associated protein